MDFVSSLGLYRQANFMNRWWWNGLVTYVKIPSASEAARIEAQFPQFMDKYLGEDFEHSGNRIDLKLEPLEEVYFNHLTRYDPVRHGNKRGVHVLLIVAIAILLIAAFNYLNLSIATAYGRAKEVGIRKVLGSNKGKLIGQFLVEALLLMLMAFALAVAISSAILPAFNQYFHLDVFLSWRNPLVWLLASILIIVMVLLSGLYPALLFASLKPIQTLKGKIFKLGKSVWMRKSLVVAQFVIAIFMIVSTLLISKQLNYVDQKDLGFDQEAVVMIEPENPEIAENLELFRDRLLSSPYIEQVTGATGEPGGFHDATTIEVPAYPVEPPLRLRTVFSDYDYLPTFDISLVAGRNFSRDFSTDMSQTAILNETAVRDLGLTPEQILGETIRLPMFDTLDRKIVGVVADYHFTSLRDEIEPLVIALSEATWQMAVKVKKGHVLEGVTDIEAVWDDIAPNYPFQYEFLDQSLAQMYRQEQNQRRVYATFAAIAIFLASLGVFGLISHSTLERKKEFNIRKVLGARIDQILALVYREFVWLIGIAALIAIPLSWKFVENWLEGFAYRIETMQYWYLFLAGGVLTLLIALLTISFRAMEAARGNPVEGLRYE